MRRGSDFLKGLVIGATMTVPGASGGTMAMLLGIYEDVLTATADVFRQTRKSLAILLPIITGGVLGAFFMAGRVETLLLFYPVEAGGFFAGLVTGGVPLLLWQAARVKKPVYHALWLLPGAAAGILLPLCPALFRGGEGLGYHLIFLPLAGVLLAAALVLPGISASAFLYVCGIYEKTLAACRDWELGFLLPLALGTAIGIFLTAKLFRRLLEKFPAGCHYVIAGFLIASASDAVRELPQGGEWQRMAVFFAVGMVMMLAFSAKEAGWRLFSKNRGDKNGDHPHRTRFRRKGARQNASRGVAGNLPGYDQ